MLHRDPLPTLGRCAAALLALTLASSCADDGEATDSSSGPDPSSETGDAPTTTTPDEGTTAAPTTSEPDDTTAATADATETGEPSCDHAVACEDAMILDLGLVDGVTSEGAVSSMPDGAGFVSEIDASAGGLPNAPMNPWVYMRFTDEGLQRVDIDDLQSLGSHDWHIAAKRFAIRINGGTGGPSCVQAALADGVAYEELDAVPGGAAFAEEAFYDDGCTLVDDGMGQGSPNYLLTPWWGYAGCVATTGVPFVLQLPDGRTLKLVIDAYYGSGQEGCNETGMMGSDSAHFTWRWSFLE
ncbi:HmuY family protein [Paraliomyxa miuraensis]|uniref:HmuY family protein n=1 Tax=Paraliomyxa miuraensis TaxID=376150 RepID=UPI00224F5512|nr:HmuY family protein [Paraliomyxa miuraensis]MCX4241047.1 HmuY family protein [Paraliomyxa miuraensis]